MAFPSDLALATKNEGKIREILEICADWPVRWVLARRSGGTSEHPAVTWPEVEETGETYLENALLKARAVAATVGVPAVADDSGIEVDALGGQPGPRSARCAGLQATDEDNLRLLIDLVPLREKLDAKMAQLVTFADRRNQAALHQKSNDEWEQWRQKTFPSDSKTGGAT